MHNILFSLVFFSISAFGQGYETNNNYLRTNNWYFGDTCIINFTGNSNFAKPLFGAFEGCSSISSESGKLQYYSNGNCLADSSNTLICSLLGYNSSSQGALFNSFDSLTFFSTTNPELGYILYNISKDNNILTLKLLRKCSEGQGAVYHQNSTNIWLSTHNLTDGYCLFLLKNGNSMCCPVVNRIGVDRNSPKITSGVLKFRPDGGQLFATTWDGQKIEMFDFNAENGSLYNYNFLPFFMPSRVEISPNFKYLYALDNATNLYQFDISSKNRDSILSTKTLILNDLNQRIGQLQIGLNEKIYFAVNNSQKIGLINKPNLMGSNCEVGMFDFELGFGESNYGLPNFNASYFYTPSIDFAYTEDCWEHTYSFEGRDTFDADGYKWIFNKVNSEERIVNSGKNCVFTFADTGRWQVSHIAWNTTRADTVTKILTIRPKLVKDVLGRDTFYCEGKKANITLRAPADMHCVHWNGEEPNLDDALGPIIDYDHFHVDTFSVDTAGTYIVKLTNKTFCQMWDTLVVDEKPRPNKSVVSRLGNLLTSDVVASKYRWYFNGTLQQTTDSNFLDPNQNGYWQVQLISEYGCESKLSDSFLVNFASTKNYELKTLNFKIYPNPSSGKFTIELEKDGNYTIQLFDAAGRLVSLSADPKGGISKTEQGKVRSTNNQIVLNLDLAAGSYTLQLTDEDGRVGSRKIEISN